MAAQLGSAFTTDREKFLAARLLRRTLVKMVCSGLCTKEKLPRGVGLTAYFARYERLYVPVAVLGEGVAPSDTSLSITEVTATMDQWGIVLRVTDVALMATKHPLAEQMQLALADAAQRIIDREIQLVWLASTNTYFGDGSVTTRGTITASMTAAAATLGKVRVYMEDTGAPPRSGPQDYLVKSGEKDESIMNGNHYAMVCGPQVAEDIMAISTSFGSWSAVATYNEANKVYQGEVGTYKGFRVIVTNFIPKYNRLGNTTVAIVSGAANSGGITGMVLTALDSPVGGTLTSSITHYFKFTRKDLLRGFEDNISIEKTQTSAATGNTEGFSVLWPSTVGFVYNVYMGTATGDANLKLVAENVAAGVTTTILAISASLVTAPPNIADAMTTAIHVIYIVAEDAAHWLGFQDLKYYEAGGEGSAIVSDPLSQLMTKGVKFMCKTMLTSSTRLMKWEVASAN